VSATTPSAPQSGPFARECELLRRMLYRGEFEVTEAPAPVRLAPQAFAQTVDIDLGDVAVGSGRLVILYDPAGQPSWQGTTRVIAYIDADVDLEVAADPVLPEVGWDWLVEALEEANATADALGGTVTQINSRSFGVMDEREPEGRLQVRASWTPKEMDLVPHATAWALLAASACGLAPTATGISTISTRR